MPKVLITGEQGFVGQHLMRELQSHGHEVFGFDLTNGFDLCKEADIRKEVLRIKPDFVYHLAAQASVPKSHLAPQWTNLVNVIGTINLLEAIKGGSPQAKILLASTGYADTMSSPYTISKLTMEYYGELYRQKYGLGIVITRAYNHTGPGQSDDFMTASFVKQIKETHKVKHGNLEQILNFTDVRDVAKAYTVAIKQPAGTYTICSEKNVTVKEILDILIKESGKKIKTELDDRLYRPTLKYDPPKCNLPEWKTEIPIEQTLKDMLGE